MAQFDVYHNKAHGSESDIPFLLDIQSNFLDYLVTCIVVPLEIVKSERQIAKILNPQFEILGISVIMSTAELAGVPRKILGKKIMSLQNYRDEIVAALDFIITGI